MSKNPPTIIPDNQPYPEFNPSDQLSVNVGVSPRFSRFIGVPAAVKRHIWRGSGPVNGFFQICFSPEDFCGVAGYFAHFRALLGPISGRIEFPFAGTFRRPGDAFFTLIAY